MTLSGCEASWSGSDRVDHPYRQFLAALLLFAFAHSNSAFAQKEKSEEPLTVSASHSNAGPYGELWIAYLAPDGDLSVRATHRQTDGQTTSQYYPHKDRVTVLRRAVDEARFFGLRNEIVPTIQHFHRPHYRLTVTLGEKQHSVAISDPKEIGATDEVKRFFIVWNALFSTLRFRPEVDVAR